MTNHSHCNHHSKNEKALLISTIILIIFMAIEITGGIFSGSLILISDAVHMFIDAFAFILALFAIKLAKKPANIEKSYGYKRGQVIAAFLNAVTLLATSIWIVIEAIERIITPVPVMANTIIIFAIIGVLVNLVIMFLLRSGTKNINIKAAMIHVIGDLLGYIAAIITGMILSKTNFLRLDPILSIVFAILIVRSSWGILKDALHILMEGAPLDIDTSDIIAKIKELSSNIIDIYHIHIWYLDQDDLVLTAHIKVKSADNYDLVKPIKILLKEEFKINHATLELEIKGSKKDICL